MTLTSVGSHLQPEVFQQIFPNFLFHIFKCTLLSGPTNAISNSHKWLKPKLVRLWWASCSAGCAPSAGSSCSTSPPISSSAGASFSPGFSILNSFAVTYKNKLWRNEIATKWVSPQFSLPIIVIVTESVWQSRGDVKRKLTSFSTSPCLVACLGWPTPLPSLSLSINQSIFNNISIRFSKKNGKYGFLF